MNVPKMGHVSFGTAYLIETRNPKVPEAFLMIDTSLRAKDNPALRWEHILTSKTDQYVKGGILLTGDEMLEYHKLEKKFKSGRGEIKEKDFYHKLTKMLNKFRETAKKIKFDSDIDSLAKQIPEISTIAKDLKKFI